MLLCTLAVLGEARHYRLPPPGNVTIHLARSGGAVGGLVGAPRRSLLSSCRFVVVVVVAAAAGRILHVEESISEPPYRVQTLCEG